MNEETKKQFKELYSIIFEQTKRNEYLQNIVQDLHRRINLHEQHFEDINENFNTIANNNRNYCNNSNNLYDLNQLNQLNLINFDTSSFPLSYFSPVWCDVENHSDMLCSFLIDECPENVHCRTIKSEDLQIKYLEKFNWTRLSWFKTLMPLTQLKAINYSPNLIGQIKNPTKEAQLAAITQDPELIKMISNPCDEALLYIELLDE